MVCPDAVSVDNETEIGRLRLVSLAASRCADTHEHAQFAQVVRRHGDVAEVARTETEDPDLAAGQAG